MHAIGLIICLMVFLHMRRNMANGQVGDAIEQNGVPSSALCKWTLGPCYVFSFFPWRWVCGF